MNKPYKAQRGDLVTIEFFARLRSDGSEVMSSEETEPFTFVVGEESIFPKLGKAVKGMILNEEKDIELSAKDAFGESSEDLIVKIEKSKLPEGIEVGVLIGDTEDEDAEWLVIEIEGDTVTLDGNHPLADKDLVFSIKVIEIESATAD